jgi:hypothetical protein
MGARLIYRCATKPRWRLPVIYDVIPDPPEQGGWLARVLVVLGVLAVSASLVLIGYLL